MRCPFRDRKESDEDTSSRSREIATRFMCSVNQPSSSCLRKPVLFSRNPRLCRHLPSSQQQSTRIPSPLRRHCNAIVVTSLGTLALVGATGGLCRSPLLWHWFSSR